MNPNPNMSPNETPINQHNRLRINTDGDPVISRPAGGLGGGVTSFADTPATSEQHVRHLETEIKAKEAELAAAKEQHAVVRADNEETKAEEARRDGERRGLNTEAENAKRAEHGNRLQGPEERRQALIAGTEVRTPAQPPVPGVIVGQQSQPAPLVPQPPLAPQPAAPIIT